MIDKSKEYTFDGETGRVLTTLRNDAGYPVVWEDSDGYLRTFTRDGRNYTNGKIRLIEVKPTQWVNIYEDVLKHDDKEAAEIAARHERSGRVRIACLEFKEGEEIGRAHV